MYIHTVIRSRPPRQAKRVQMYSFLIWAEKNPHERASIQRDQLKLPGIPHKQHSGLDVDFFEIRPFNHNRRVNGIVGNHSQ